MFVKDQTKLKMLFACIKGYQDSNEFKIFSELTKFSMHNRVKSELEKTKAENDSLRQKYEQLVQSNKEKETEKLEAQKHLDSLNKEFEDLKGKFSPDLGSDFAKANFLKAMIAFQWFMREKYVS
jgi:dynactin complex subunit